MQVAADRVTKLALLDTGMRSQNEAERAVRRARIRLAEEGHFELVLGLQMSRFLPAYRLPDKKLVDEVMAMCGEIGVEIYKRQEELAAVRADRRPDLPGSSARPSWCAAATMRRRRCSCPRRWPRPFPPRPSSSWSSAAISSRWKSRKRPT